MTDEERQEALNEGSVMKLQFNRKSDANYVRINVLADLKVVELRLLDVKKQMELMQAHVLGLGHRMGPAYQNIAQKMVGIAAALNAKDLAEIAENLNHEYAELSELLVA